VTACRVATQDWGSAADHIRASRLPHQRREPVHSGGDVVEGSRPAAIGLAGTAEFRRADGKTRSGQRDSQRACVGPVVGRSPEPAVQEQHQRRRARPDPGRSYTSPNGSHTSTRRSHASSSRNHASPGRRRLRRRRGQANVGYLIPAGAVGDHKVRGRCRPGKYVIGCHRTFMIPICGSPLANAAASDAYNLGLSSSGLALPVILRVYFPHLLGKFGAGGAGPRQVSS
jgi:hypothetical protein